MSLIGHRMGVFCNAHYFFFIFPQRVVIILLRVVDIIQLYGRPI